MKTSNRILVVDDAEINRSLLIDILTPNYQVIEACDGLEAVSILNRQHANISLILLDIIMPHMNGFQVLETMNKNHWIEDIPVIVISAETSSNLIDQAYNLGAFEFINRPFDPQTVSRRVRNALVLYAKQKKLENLVTNQILQNEQNSRMMIEILSHIVEFRNGESGQHIRNIRHITNMLLKQLTKITDIYPLTNSRMSIIVNASALHDIGKISIPEGILNKPAKLTPEEYEIIKTHSAIGAQMLERIQYYENEPLIREARDICRWHHERYDGKGYPDQLAGEEIPISAQVVSLADVYDALTSERVYKPAYSPEVAMEMIMRGECGAFNPLLLRALQEIAPQLTEDLHHISIEKKTKRDLTEMTRSLLDENLTSNRTLALLEQERAKYRFFASVTKEIQFEYNYQTEILQFSEWGADHYHLPEVIVHPRESAVLNSIISKNHLRDFVERIARATQEDPIIQQVYPLVIDGQKRWYRVIALVLWSEDTQEISSIAGKLIDVHEDQLELKRFRKKAYHDDLTQLYNRDYAKMTINRRLKDCNHKHRYALLLFDLDSFKSANDRYGHLFGDHVLKKIAVQMNELAKKLKILAARIGGDEFLLFTEYDDNVEEIADMFFQRIKGYYEDFMVEVSAGVALAPQDGLNYDDLLHHADLALYTAKQKGRNRYYFYESWMEDALINPPSQDNEEEEKEEENNDE